MSLENELAEVKHSVQILTRSVDLLSAIIGDLLSNKEALSTLSNMDMPIHKPEEPQPKPEPESQPEPTEDEIKSRPEYVKLAGLASELMRQELEANENDREVARQIVIDLLTDFVPDGKVFTLISQGAPEVIADCIKAFEALLPEPAPEPEPAKRYSADEVRKALRAYAKRTSRQEAVDRLKEATGEVVVANLEIDQYAAAIKSLTIKEETKDDLSD